MSRTIAGVVLGLSLAVIAAIAVLAACSDPLRAGVDRAPEGSFVDASVLETSTEVALCNSSECPSPYATCPGKSGLCTANLSSDSFHCGSCDMRCPPDTGHVGAFFVCEDARCEMHCRPNMADCNHVVDDGCEAALLSDPANCGACGNACAPGELCWLGACGCPPSDRLCNGQCVRVTDDPLNCGACGHSCDSAEVDWSCGEGVVPDGADVRCIDSKCRLACVGGADCNSDFCGDGCETPTYANSKNCGACGKQCSDEQICFAGRCLCDPGATRCNYECFDLQNNAKNCGACGRKCPGAEGPTGSPACELGRCSYVCAVGYADCDGHIENGCEVDLTVDPRNCGSCGTQCDLAGGQPCAAGKCLTQPCDAGVVH